MSALADPARGTIHAQIEIAAAPEAVFRALTDPRELAAWWGSPETYRTSSWKVDLRPGGMWSAEAENVAERRRSTVRGQYLAVDPPRLVEYTWEPSWEPSLRTVVRIELEPVAGGTRVTVRHSGFEGRAAACEDHARGWDQVLAWLSRHAGGGAR
jgi:uncharacterized protein YndB with AHSA1/START domain